MPRRGSSGVQGKDAWELARLGLVAARPFHDDHASLLRVRTQASEHGVQRT